MEHITKISSVSGGSLAASLIFAASGLKWPTSAAYLNRILPAIEKTILTHDIEKSALRKLPFYPKYWRNKAGLIAGELESQWGIQGTLQDLPTSPVWTINCTTFETGKSFQIAKAFMGDYRIGYVPKPVLPISQAAAASAGFPILIGPFRLHTDQYQWYGGKQGAPPIQPEMESIHLWDGGVYDNLGLESLYKIGRGLIPSLDRLIVSNASGSIEYSARKGTLSAHNMKRLLDISMDQVEALRSRDVFHEVVRNGKGMYIKIGNSAEKILSGCNPANPQIKKLLQSCMSPERALAAMNYPTTLSSPSKEDYRMLLRHGYETAKCIYCCPNHASMRR